MMSCYKGGSGGQMIAAVSPEIMLKIKNFVDYYGTTAVPVFTIPRTENTLGMTVILLSEIFTLVLTDFPCCFLMTFKIQLNNITR